ncbi:hypothetical protein YC2023_091102 [Brassica napus]
MLESLVFVTAIFPLSSLQRYCISSIGFLAVHRAEGAARSLLNGEFVKLPVSSAPAVFRVGASSVLPLDVYGGPSSAAFIVMFFASFFFCKPVSALVLRVCPCSMLSSSPSGRCLFCIGLLCVAPWWVHVRINAWSSMRVLGLLVLGSLVTFCSCWRILRKSSAL